MSNAASPSSDSDHVFFQHLVFFDTLLAGVASLAFTYRVVWLRRNGVEHNLGRTACIYYPSQLLMVSACLALIVGLMVSEQPLDLSSIVASVFMLIAWALAIVLNYYEHRFSIRSSDPILCFYIIVILSSSFSLYSTADQHHVPQEFMAARAWYTSFLILAAVVEVWPRDKTRVQQQSKASTFEKANLISRLSFYYIQNIMSRGYTRPLQLADIKDLMPERVKSEHAYSKLEATWRQLQRDYDALPKGKQQQRQPWLLLMTIATCYGWIGWAPIVFYRVLSTTLIYVQPLLLSRILTFMQSSISEDAQPLSQGIMLAFLMFLTSLSSSVSSAQLTQLNAERGMEIRSGLIGLIYRKSLRLSSEARRTQTVGSITNHMSVDTEKWINALNTLPQWVSAPIEVIVALWMLYNQLGWCALVGLVTVVGLMPIQNKASNVFSEIKNAKLTAMDGRIRVVTELFSSIKAIKLYGWEDAFRSKISGYRKIEIAVLRRFGMVYAAMTITFSTTMFMSLLSFGIYAAVGGPGETPGEITPQVIFVSLALFGLLSKPISWMDHLLSDTTSILVATRRIQGFLLSEELQDENDYQKASGQYHSVHQQRPEDPAVIVQDAAFSWSRPAVVVTDEDIVLTECTPLLDQDASNVASAIPTLRDIRFMLKSGSLTAVVGRIGQGKSSLISALIGDMYRDRGSVRVSGSVAYVAQEAWIMNCTLKDNILFGRPLDQNLYEKVLQACSLTQDLQMLPAGDQTEIGERGINLSGGQKQRVSLARAAYADADIYLLDDPLSAVDAHVDQHLWQHLIGPKGLLKDKTRLLVTHGIRHLNEVDQILVMKDGAVSEIGALDELLGRKNGFFQFHQEFSATKTTDFRCVEGGILVQTEGTAGSENEWPEMADDADTSAVVAQAQDKAKDAVQEKAELVAPEKMMEGGVGWQTFIVYAKAASYRNIILVIILYVLVEIAQVGTGFWLRFWSDAAGQEQYSVAQFLVIYGAFTLAYMGFNMALFYVANVEASVTAARYLHDRLLNNLLRQPMSFFDTTPVGRIINRFSSDVEAVDETIIWNFIDVVYCLVAIGGTMVVISVSTPLFLLVVPPLVMAYLSIQRYYVRSSQALKRVLSVSKSPLYQHFGETLAGVSTIRAMRATSRFIDMNERKADLAAEITLASGISGRWLKVRLEFLGGLIVLAAALLAVLDRGRLGASVVGLSLTYAMSITLDITYLVRTWSEMSNQLISVERIEEYVELKQEAPEETGIRLPEDWPAEGRITFRNYSTSYRQGLDLVLKNVSFNVLPGQKIGIVGRTGAGKSSLTLALFRLVEAAGSYWLQSQESNHLVEQTVHSDNNDGGGSIEIDGIDIATLGLKTLRQHLSIIPQDPTLFVGTVRDNLDPFEQAPDSELWEALERAHLKDYISSMPGGLSYEVTQNGENFSVGQRSLICLARALLRKTKILILDEATAAVDVETDELIQRTIRTEFKDRTILTIAHRIKTVMDSDRILVLERGRVQEYEAPSVLLMRKESLFYKLAEQAGEI